MEIYVRYHTPVDPSPPILLVSVYFHRKELRSSGAPELPPSAAAARTGRASGDAKSRTEKSFSLQDIVQAQTITSSGIQYFKANPTLIEM